MSGVESSLDGAEQAMLDEAIRLSMLDATAAEAALAVTCEPSAADFFEDNPHVKKRRRDIDNDNDNDNDNDTTTAATASDTSAAPFAFGSGRYVWDNVVDKELPHPPNTSVSYAELIDADLCQRALIASMLVMPDWLVPHIGRIPHVCVVKDPLNFPPADPEVGGVIVLDRVIYVSPVQPVLEKNDYSLMHVKLHIFQFADDRLRVVICSANGSNEEWCAMGQSVWFQDFPRRRHPHPPPDSPKGAAFRATLYRLLDLWQHVPPEFAQPWLDQWSFDDTHATLVLSAPGLWDGSALLGMNSLREAVRAHNPPLDAVLPVDDTNTLEYQPAHVGFLVSRWFNGQFLKAALAPPSGTAPNYRNALVSVVYLTRRTGRALAGPSLLDNLCGLAHNSIPSEFASNPQLFNRPDFADFRPRRGVPYHSKNCTRVWAEGGGAARGWTYCGSHNLTAAAWGSHRGTKLLIRNFELGVVLPYPCAHVYNHGSPKGMLMTWQRPPPRYTATDEPWKITAEPAIDLGAQLASPAYGGHV
jgi:hypothetical protein